MFKKLKISIWFPFTEINHDIDGFLKTFIFIVYFYLYYSLLQSRPCIKLSRLYPETPPSHVSSACLWLLAHLFLLRFLWKLNKRLDAAQKTGLNVLIDHNV
jgi:hypothetical protein